MSTSSSRISHKNRLNPKINNLKITPFYTNHTTENSCKKDLNINSHQDNLNVKVQISSRNIKRKKDKYNSYKKYKNLESQRNMSLKNIINNKFIKKKGTFS